MPINERFEWENHKGPATKYNDEIAEEICSVTASHRIGLQRLVEQHAHWPSRTTIFKWLRLYPDFREKYYKAKEDQTEIIFDYAQDLIDESPEYIDKNGTRRIDVALLNAILHHLRWHLGKLKPRKFGDASQQEVVNTELDADIAKRHAGLQEPQGALPPAPPG